MGKKQHYVPRMLLKNFSTLDNIKTIGLFLLKDQSFLDNVSLRDQAYENNLYGKDQIIEKIYAEIEAASNPVINKLLREELPLDPQEEANLKIFITSQYSRTKFAKDLANESMDKMFKEMVKNEPKLSKNIDDFKIVHTEPYKFMFNVTSEMAVVISDLQISLLKNETKIPFIIGEHPITILNPFLVERKWKGSKNGLGVKGAMIYLPLSTKYGVVLYDRIRYRTHRFKKIVSISVKDITKLNSCQMALTQDCIFYSSKDNIPFEDYYIRTDDYRKNDKITVKVYSEKKSKKQRKKKGYKELMMTGSKELPIKQNFEFINLLESALYEDLGQTMDISRDAIKQYIKR